MLDHSFSEEIPSSKPFLVQHEAIPSHSIACYLRQEIDSLLTTESLQVLIECENALLQKKKKILRVVTRKHAHVTYKGFYIYLF